MKLQHRAFQSLKTFIIAAGVLGVGSSSAYAAEGHGGGAGHTVAGAGRGGVYAGGYRGYGYGGYGRGYGYGYGWGGWGLGLGLGLGLGYGLAYPYYGDPYYGYAYPGYYPGYGYAPPNGPPPPPVPANPASPTGGDVKLIVRTPADAIVWINGQKTTQSGERREFVSSGVALGRNYTFDVRAQWTGSDGRPVDIEQRIPLQAGEQRTVEFGKSASAFIETVAPVAAEAKH